MCAIWLTRSLESPSWSWPRKLHLWLRQEQCELHARHWIIQRYQWFFQLSELELSCCNWITLRWHIILIWWMWCRSCWSFGRRAWWWIWLWSSFDVDLSRLFFLLCLLLNFFLSPFLLEAIRLTKLRILLVLNRRNQPLFGPSLRAFSSADTGSGGS